MHAPTEDDKQFAEGRKYSERNSAFRRHADLGTIQQTTQGTSRANKLTEYINPIRPHKVKLAKWNDEWT